MGGERLRKAVVLSEQQVRMDPLSMLSLSVADFFTDTSPHSPMLTPMLTSTHGPLAVLASSVTDAELAGTD
eukprot:238498-Rhodomonas_salina.2